MKEYYVKLYRKGKPVHGKDSVCKLNFADENLKVGDSFSTSRTLSVVIIKRPFMETVRVILNKISLWLLIGIKKFILFLTRRNG